MRQGERIPKRENNLCKDRGNLKTAVVWNMPRRSGLAHHPPAPAPDTLMPTSLVPRFHAPAGWYQRDRYTSRASVLRRRTLQPCSPVQRGPSASNLFPSRLELVAITHPGGTQKCGLKSARLPLLTPLGVWKGPGRGLGRITDTRSRVTCETSQGWKEKLSQAKNNSLKEQN